MSQNNNSLYSYNYMNSYQNQVKILQGSQSTNSNKIQRSQKPQTTSSNLLPYHEYMVLQKQNISGQFNPNASVNQQHSPGHNSQSYNQTYHQPNYTGTQQSYQKPAINQFSGQYNQYYPQTLQPYNYYHPNPAYLYPNQNLGQNNTQNISSVQDSSKKLRNQASNAWKSQAIQKVQKNQEKVYMKGKQQISSAKNFYNQRKQQTFYRNQADKKSFPSKNTLYDQGQMDSSPKRVQDSRQKNQSRKPYYNQYHDENPNQSSNQDWSQQQEQQQIIYQKYQAKKNSYYSQSSAKTKLITKKKDSVHDSPDQIRKWIEARKRNYPGPRNKMIKLGRQQIKQQNVQTAMDQEQKKEMSKLQAKIRKKLIIVNGDSRSIMKKIKNIEILRRIVQDPKILKKQRKFKSRQYPQQKIVRQDHNNITQNHNTIRQDHKNIRQDHSNIRQDHKTIRQDHNNIRQDLIQMEGQKQIKQRLTAQKPIYKQKIPKPLQMRDQQQVQLSENSIQPEQVPANKIQKIQVSIQNQIQKQDKAIGNNKIGSVPRIFQFVDKHKETATQSRGKRTQEKTHKKDYTNKVLDPQSIIAHLRQKQQQDKLSLNTLFDYKSNSHTYRYRVQTLQTSLKLDDIFAETTYLLQAVRYIIRQNFFQNQEK